MTVYTLIEYLPALNARLEVCDHEGDVEEKDDVLICRECGCAWRPAREVYWLGTYHRYVPVTTPAV